ncbi:tRNA pseudouridine(55) synthase TruB [Candidatus Babeliales bacterium]|nr:tRNA pseudouridine(55) synthase TruB [Candidatus Babeliales bacterium]
MAANPLCGFLTINKPSGITSYDCIRHIKKLLKTKIKIGHAGTLDPLASGVMIIAIGRDATKNLGTLSNLSKTYGVIAKLGETTDTLDSQGTIIDQCKIPELSEKNIESVLKNMLGEQEQIPPVFSALKHKGTSLHKYARTGKIEAAKLEQIAEAKKRTITIHDIALISWQSPFLQFTAHVSKGTYARVLACDIAKKLNTCASTHILTRTAIGNIDIEQTHLLKNLDSLEKIEQNLMPPNKFIAHLKLPAR